MIEAESGCAITFNGEIYNFQELRRELESSGETFHSSCDTEVILKSYKRWGIEAVGRLRGIFAFALWDPRGRAVHLVRDQMGIKPLYWTEAAVPETGEAVILFASEIRALLASGLVPRRLDPAAVASFLWHGFVVGPQTIVANVHLLPSATTLTILCDGHPRSRCTERRYWHMPSSRSRKTTEAELREELKATVRMQLVSDVPLGVFLSGGIDSSAVAALASEAAPGSLHTFTIGFDLEAYDESGFASRVAQALDSHHTRVLLTENQFREQLPRALAAIDQPTFDGINTYFVSRAARDAGMTVALAGTGGDELFGGYRSYVDIPRAMQMTAWLPFGAAGGIGRRVSDTAAETASALIDTLYWKVLGMAPPQTRWGKVADVAHVVPDVLGLYQVSYALFTRRTQEALADEAVREAQLEQDCGLPLPVARDWRERTEGNERRHAVSLLELSSFVGERLLRDTDAASMAASLEVRVPLLDHALLETVAGVDAERRFSPPRKKQLLRDATLGSLDPGIFERPKAGFVLPIDTWARRTLHEQMEATFSDPVLAARAGVRSEPVQTLWRSFTAGRRGQYWSRVWALYVLLSWCQTHDVALR